jgi:hypothetical protein
MMSMLLFLLFLSPCLFADSLTLKPPLKVKGEWPSQKLNVSEIVIRFEDTIGVTHHIGRILDESFQPIGYASHIETPVCSDTLCNLMDIRMYWTLAGTYWGFDTIPGKPLTKNDHLEFVEADYQKLHELLMDEQSILRRRHKDDLFDKESTRVSQVVDAVTGATAKEVKEAVVDGAVYSSYTIYHLVHSQLAAVIREDVKRNLFDQVGEHLIRSERVDERMFFIRELKADQMTRYLDEIVKTVRQAVPRDRLYVMKKIPLENWKEQGLQSGIAAMVKELDVHSLSHFLNQLKDAGLIHPVAVRSLGEGLPGFTANQVKAYLALVELDRSLVYDEQILSAIKLGADLPDFQHAVYLKAFLQKHRIEAN